jgi:hypothetical protein
MSDSILGHPQSVYVLRNLLEQQDDLPVVYQVVDMNGNAWNMACELGVAEGVMVVQLAHPQLRHLPNLEILFPEDKAENKALLTALANFLKANEFKDSDKGAVTILNAMQQAVFESPESAVATLGA